MKRSGYADLPLHGGKVPLWLSSRMAKLGGAIVESVISEYGKSELISRMSDPFWFQSLGAVLGMDWHSSGITTSVMGALKKSVNAKSAELGIYICGGKGKFSRQTPFELLKIADQTGLNGNELVYASKAAAKVDNTAIQDGFQLYLHSFILSDEGEWAVVQQGMNENSGMARRYHWHSRLVKSFIEEPHTSIVGVSQGMILNLTDQLAAPSRQGMLDISSENPVLMIPEIKRIIMPRHHEVTVKDVDLKRLGAVLAVAWERKLRNFEELLMLEGMGPRTIQSLALVSEVIHGTPTRFKDPARFSFAHGGKDKHPFPVPTKVYDETISFLSRAVDKSKIELTEKQKAMKALHQLTVEVEKNFTPGLDFDKVIEKERKDSWKYGGKSVFGDEKPPQTGGQLDLFS
jgi:uncharacterized protein